VETSSLLVGRLWIIHFPRAGAMIHIPFERSPLEH